MGDMDTIVVELGDRSYRVVVGDGIASMAPELIPAGARRVAVVTQQGVPSALVPDLGGLAVSMHEVGAGEGNKTLATVERLCEEFARAGVTRGDAVLAVGGGMVTDVAGFAAAVFHRGIAVVHVPTTLLGMIDAAIGGKTGVNLSAGKNLVGAFWQPVGVLCDLAALRSLPERERRCGLGEMAKYHFIAREDLSELPLNKRIARCIEIKARVVAEDEREGAGRALLNYGHTLGHALEIRSNFSLAHGEAVALGLLYAAELARILGRIDDQRVEEHYRVVRDVYGLRPALPPELGFDPLLESMRRDKKVLDGLTFVLDSGSGLETVRDVDARRAREAFDALKSALEE